MRTAFALCALLLTAACGRAAEKEIAVATADSDGSIECRIGADTQFVRNCKVERSRAEDGVLLTVHKPDGGFRRLKAVRDGQGVVAADGAEKAEVKIVRPDLIEVAIAGDNFRLPAKVGPVPQQGK